MPCENSVLRSRRLCLFLPSLASGGVQRMFVHMARYFVEHEGLAVDLVLGEAKGPHLEEVRGDIRVIDLKASRLLKAVAPLAGYLTNERPGSLITGMPHSNIVALWARAQAGAPTRVVIGERNLPRQEVAGARGLAWKLIPFLARRYYGQADAIVAVSREAARGLASMAHLPPERITVIYNPVITEETLRRMGDDLRHPWFEAGAPPVILSVGRLAAQKDFPTLIRAFARVRARRAARLMILGEGDQRPVLEKLRDRLGITDDVALPGHISNPYPYYPRAAVFALSSTFEGFGNVVVEALAAGTPVVSTRCGGPVEILEGGKYGRLVPVEDDEALADAIESQLGRPTPPELLKERAAEFSVGRIAPRYLECVGMSPRETAMHA